MDLNGKCVLLGVTGGIAAYKMANVASALRKLGADVEVIMTQNATQFITPLTFETLTGHKCMVDTFDRDFKFEVTHISLAKKADVILVAPATANVIAKMAHGIADDMLTTVVLAAGCPKLVSPAMNTGMLENPITQDNLATLERYGFTVIPSQANFLFAAHPQVSGMDLYTELKRRGILVRHFEEPRIRNFNRITIGTPDQMEALLDAITRILNETV